MSLLDYRGYQGARKKGFRWEKRRKNFVIEIFVVCRMAKRVLSCICYGIWQHKSV